MTTEKSETPDNERQIEGPLFTIESATCGGLELRNIVVRDEGGAACVQEILVAIVNRTELPPTALQSP